MYCDVTLLHYRLRNRLIITKSVHNLIVDLTVWLDFAVLTSVDSFKQVIYKSVYTLKSESEWNTSVNTIVKEMKTERERKRKKPPSYRTHMKNCILIMSKCCANVFMVWRHNVLVLICGEKNAHTESELLLIRFLHQCK